MERGKLAFFIALFIVFGVGVYWKREMIKDIFLVPHPVEVEGVLSGEELLPLQEAFSGIAMEDLEKLGIT